MDPTKQERVIEYLLTRKFPYHRAIRATLARTPSLATARTPAGLERQKSLSAAAAYKVELRAMSPEELAVAVKQERVTDENLVQSLPLANFQHWAKAPYWTLEEATALSFGKEPKVDTRFHYSSLPADYARVRDLVERSKVMGQIDDPVIPRDFIAWAKRSGIDYPPELEAELITQGQLVDWKAHSEKADQTIASLIRERDELLIQVQELQKSATTEKKPLGERERQSLLKIIIGMAAKKYGYNPHAKRSDVAKNIVSDMNELGIDLDADTVRKWLDKAVDEVTPKAAFGDGDR